MSAMCWQQQAEELLIEWATVTRDRDNRVRSAVAAGISKNRVSKLTGIGRMTIDRILSAHGPAQAVHGPEGGDQHVS